MAKFLFISALILLAFYAKATKQRQELRDSNVRRDMTPRQVHELFPRVCGLHGWKKCGRRRSSVKVTVSINITNDSIDVAALMLLETTERTFIYLCKILNLYLIILYEFHFYFTHHRQQKRSSERQFSSVVCFHPFLRVT